MEVNNTDAEGRLILADAIARAAELRHADEIVIGSRGAGRVSAMLGSVAHDVIHRAHCPVVVIPERALDIALAPSVALAHGTASAQTST